MNAPRTVAHADALVLAADEAINEAGEILGYGSYWKYAGPYGMLWTTRSAPQLLGDLAAVIERLGLAKGAATSLGAKLLAASAQLGRGELEAACHALRAFQDELAAQDGEALTSSQVVRLDGRARGVEQVLGCGAR